MAHHGAGGGAAVIGARRRVEAVRRGSGAEHRRLALALVLTLAVAGCGGGDDVDPEVRAFSDVQDGEMAFESDPTDPTRGIFRVSTTEPMICAIVWGEDESYGRFNNSLAMNGTGIVDHDVVLPDVIDVSSEFSDDFAAAHAFDDDPSTEWSTRGDGDEAFVAVDLGEERDIVAVEFVTRSMADGSAVTEQYSVSVDGGEPAGPFPAGTVARRQVSELTATGREVRFAVQASTGGNVGAVEIRLFGPPG